jgi:deoxyribonuclease-4
MLRYRTMMRLGVHVSIAGGWAKALERATQLGCTTMQIFSRSPRGGAAPPLVEADVDAFDRERRARDIAPLVVHAPYIINLASIDPKVREFSRRLYTEEYARCTRLGADFLVTHVGSHKGNGEETGVASVAEAVDEALGQAPKSQVMILLENTAGSGQGLGYGFEQLVAIRGRVGRRARVGICLDTAHLLAAGFRIHEADGLEQTVADFDRIAGLGLLKVMHLNDSKAPFDSRVDRHWHIGQGHIGLEAMGRIVTHPALASVPMILETPKETDEDDPRNLATVRRLRAATKAQHATAPSRRRQT